MTTIRVIYGEYPLFFNFGCDRYVKQFETYLIRKGWRRYDVLTNCCQVITINKNTREVKDEMLADFWNWLAEINGIFQ